MAELTQAEAILFAGSTNVLHKLESEIFDPIRLECELRDCIERARAALPAHAVVATTGATIGHNSVKQ